MRFRRVLTVALIAGIATVGLDGIAGARVDSSTSTSTSATSRTATCRQQLERKQDRLRRLDAKARVKNRRKNRISDHESPRYQSLSRQVDQIQEDMGLLEAEIAELEGQCG